jgi:hypothetical protein
MIGTKIRHALRGGTSPKPARFFDDHHAIARLSQLLGTDQARNSGSNHSNISRITIGGLTRGFVARLHKIQCWVLMIDHG